MRIAVALTKLVRYCGAHEVSNSQSRVNLLLSRVPWQRHQQEEGELFPQQRQAGRKAEGQQEQAEAQDNHEARHAMIYKRGTTYWYNFRWAVRSADGSSELFRVRRTAKTA